MYNKLDTIDFKEYSGLTDDFINFCKETERNFKIPLLNYQLLNLLFLPEEIDNIKDVITQISHELDDNRYIVANMKDYDKYLEVSTILSKCLNIKNPATTFLDLLDLAFNNMERVKFLAFNNNEIDNIPLSVILGKSEISKEYAKIIDSTLSKMVDEGVMKKTRV